MYLVVFDITFNTMKVPFERLVELAELLVELFGQRASELEQL